MLIKRKEIEYRQFYMDIREKQVKAPPRKIPISQITRDIPLENVAVFLPYFGADGQDRKIRIPDEFPHKITACYDSAGTFYRYSF